MAKIFKIKRKGLRYTAGSFLLLLIIGVVLAIAAIIFWGLGHAAYALNISFLVDFIEDYQGNTTNGRFLFSGFTVIFAIFAIGYYGWVFSKGARNLANRYFNSVGEKEEAEKAMDEKVSREVEEQINAKID